MKYQAKVGKNIFLSLLGIGLLFSLFSKFIRPYPDRVGFPLQQIWSQNVKGDIKAISATQDGTTIFARTYSFLYAIEPESGAIRWRYIYYFQRSPKPPIAYKGIVYFADERALYAVSQSDGKEIWRARRHGSADNVIFVSDKITLLNGVRYLSAYETETGNYLWQTHVGSIDFNVSIIDDMVFAYGDFGVRSYSISTGEKIDDPHPANASGQVQGNGTVHFFADDTVFQYDLQERSVVWRIPMAFYTSSEFALHQNILIATDGFHIYALDNRNGIILWTANLTNPVNPVIIDNTVYVMEGFSRKIFAFDLETGKIKGALHASLPVFLRAEREDMAGAGSLLILSIKNFVYAFGP